MKTLCTLLLPGEIEGSSPKVQRTVIFVELPKYKETKGAAHRDIIGTSGKIALSISHFNVLYSDIPVRCTY